MSLLAGRGKIKNAGGKGEGRGGGEEEEEALVGGGIGEGSVFTPPTPPTLLFSMSSNRLLNAARRQ